MGHHERTRLSASEVKKQNLLGRLEPETPWSTPKTCTKVPARGRILAMKLEQLAKEAKGANIRIKVRRRRYSIEILRGKTSVAFAVNANLEAAACNAAAQLRGSP